jgi:hypothetical protein
VTWMFGDLSTMTEQVEPPEKKVVSEMPYGHGHVEKPTDVTGTGCDKWSERSQKEKGLGPF